MCMSQNRYTDEFALIDRSIVNTVLRVNESTDKLVSAELVSHLKNAHLSTVR